MKNNVKYLLIAFFLFIISCSNYKIIDPFAAGDSILNEDSFISGPDATDFDIEYNMREYYKQYGKYKIIISGDISSTSTLSDVKKIIDKQYYKDAKAQIEVDLTRTTLTEIKSDAFKGCTALISVSLPDTLTSIKSSVFSRCTALSAVSLNSKLTTIEDSAFKGCTALISISLPESLTAVNNNSFDGCTELANLEYLGKDAKAISVTLSGVTKLVNLYLPNVAKDPGGGSWDTFLGITWTKINYGISM